MKIKRYAIYYQSPITHEAVVCAPTKKEAIRKVKEVIGNPVTIESAYEIFNPRGNKHDK